jgi:YD repeat-containing protein
MNKKYERYINYIVNDIEKPYFINMKDNYGLRPDEYELVLSKIYDQPVTIKGNYVYNTNGNLIYTEYSNGVWVKREYDTNGKQIYYEDSNGSWEKYEYDSNGNRIYYENSDGNWVKREYDANGNIIYREYSDGYISDNR